MQWDDDHNPQICVIDDVQMLQAEGFEVELPAKYTWFIEYDADSQQSWVTDGKDQWKTVNQLIHTERARKCHTQEWIFLCNTSMDNITRISLNSSAKLAFDSLIPLS